MQHTTHTPPTLDHVLAVIGKDRFVRQFDLPFDQWDLTPREMLRIKVGSHGEMGVYLVDSEYAGITLTDVTVECECGELFSDRLLSRAQAQYDAHIGRAAVSHTHTAEILAG